MSIINEALKKAARQRAEDQSDSMANMHGASGSGNGRRTPMRSQTMVLIGAAALALIVVSVVITGLLLTGKSQPKVDFVTATVPTTEVPASVTVQMPTISLAPLPKPMPTPIVAAVSTPLPSAPAVQVTVKAPEPAAPSPTVAVPELSHADRVEAFMDNLHVSGVRAAGTDSKALVDGHVYRVNDVLNRPLGLKLVKIEEGQLTFVDSRGDTYIKNF